MSDISPLQHSAAASYSPTGRARPAPAAATPSPRGSDRAEFSNVSQILARLNQPAEVRLDLVNQIRSEIEAGTYETDAKLDAAIESLAEDLV